MSFSPSISARASARLAASASPRAHCSRRAAPSRPRPWGRPSTLSPRGCTHAGRAGPRPGGGPAPATLRPRARSPTEWSSDASTCAFRTPARPPGIDPDSSTGCPGWRARRAYGSTDSDFSKAACRLAERSSSISAAPRLFSAEALAGASAAALRNSVTDSAARPDAEQEVPERVVGPPVAGLDVDGLAVSCARRPRPALVLERSAEARCARRRRSGGGGEPRNTASACSCRPLARYSLAERHLGLLARRLDLQGLAAGGLRRRHVLGRAGALVAQQVHLAQARVRAREARVELERLAEQVTGLVELAQVPAARSAEAPAR